MNQRICPLILNVLGIEIPCAFPDKECKFKKINWNGIDIYTCDNVNDEIGTIIYLVDDDQNGF